YNSYLNQYLLVSGSNIYYQPGLWLAASSDGINWSPRTRLTESLYPIPPDKNPYQHSLVWGPTLVGTGNNPSVLGQTFYVYGLKDYDRQAELESVTRYQINLRNQCP